MRKNLFDLQDAESSRISFLFGMPAKQKQEAPSVGFLGSILLTIVWNRIKD